MALYRRTWLKLIAHSSWLALILGKWVSAQPAPAQFPSQALQLLVDTLVPADESPGAVELGLHIDIEAGIRRRASYQELLVSGVVWFDRESEQRYQATFSQLSATARELLLTVAEKSPRASAQHRLFNVLRSDVMRRYYTRAEAWTLLGYQGPPQPLGFANYNKSPVAPLA